MREFKVGKVYLDAKYNTEVKVEIIDIENNLIYFSGYKKTDFYIEHNGFYKFGLDVRLEHLTSGRYKELLKIGDTFEYNGFVCEVKEKIEKNIWFLLINKHTKSIAYRYAKEKEFDSFDNDKDYECIRVINKEFIKQLEENAR